MENRREQLNELHVFIGNVDTELALLMQHLQWDRKQLLEGKFLAVCKYDHNHSIPEENLKKHEEQCLLRHNGYKKEDVLFPDPLDESANTLIKLNKTDIAQIIHAAAHTDPSFRKGASSTKETEHEVEPLTLGRLQLKYSADERRAIHDAVVKAAPLCHDLSDLALPSENGESNTNTKEKSRVEILAELRNMKRRRTKYRVAAKTRNYSDVLRDVIKTQMEVYSDIKVEETTNPNSTHGKEGTDRKIQSQRHSREEFRPHEQRKPSKESAFNKSKYSSETRRTYDHDKKSESEQRYYGHRKRKEEERYREDKSSSFKRQKIHRVAEEENTDHEGYREIKCKEERCSEDRSSSGRQITYDSKQEIDSGHKGYDEGKYYRDKRSSHTSRHKSSYDTSSYKGETKDLKHKKDNKKDDRERKSYSEKSKYKTDKHSSNHTSRSRREDKYVSKRYYDDYEYEKKYKKKKFAERIYSFGTFK